MEKEASPRSGRKCCGVFGPVRCGSKFRLDFDWAFLINEILIRLVMGVALLLVNQLATPFVRQVYPDNWGKYAYPYSPSETFSFGLSAALCAAFLVFSILLWTIVLRFVNKWHGRLLAGEIILFLLSFSFSVLMTVLTTEIIKRMYGRLRPDFLARCYETNDQSLWEATPIENIPSIPHCIHPGSSLLEDGRMSFPSAHTSIFWACFFHLSLYYYGKFSLYQNLGILRVAVAASINVLPLCVAITRTCDYRHHYSDVIAGALIGIFWAVLGYVYYYPLRMEPVMVKIYGQYESRGQKHVSEKYPLRMFSLGGEDATATEAVKDLNRLSSSTLTLEEEEEEV